MMESNYAEIIRELQRINRRFRSTRSNNEKQVLMRARSAIASKHFSASQNHIQINDGEIDVASLTELAQTHHLVTALCDAVKVLRGLNRMAEHSQAISDRLAVSSKPLSPIERKHLESIKSVLVREISEKSELVSGFLTLLLDAIQKGKGKDVS